MAPRWLQRSAAWLPPYQVPLAALGVVAAFIPWLPKPPPDPQIILAVFIPALVFEAALNLDLGALRRMARPVGLLATVGVAVSIGLLAAAAHYLLGFAWTGALLLGAILSPTDPIAVVAVVRRSGAPPQLAALLEGESLFNDGTGVAAFAAVLGVVAGGGVSLPAIGLDFLLLAGAGALVGVAVGVIGSYAVRATTSTLLEVIATVVVAYASYGLATLAGASGVIAVVCAGVALARVRGWGVHTERWWARLAILLNTRLFLWIGAGLPGYRIFGALPLVLGGFATLLAVRLVLVHLPGLGIPGRGRQLLWWGGVRGALSVALALAASAYAGVDRSVPLVAYGVVALSLLTQGTIVRPAVRLLRLDR